MENKFNLMAMQKKGSASTSSAIDYIIGGLIVVILISALAGSIFGYLGTGATGLGNATTNPDVPTWLPLILIVVVAVGLLYMVIRVMGISKR